MEYSNKEIHHRKNVFVNKIQTLLETHIIRWMFSCKRWTSTKFVRLELTVKTLALSKHEEIILKFMCQTKEKCDSLVLSRSSFEWYEDAMRTTSTSYSNFFESNVLKITWSTIIFIIFRDFLMFYQFFLFFFSPQVKRCTIITYRDGIYELSNNLRHRILGN